MTRGFSLDPTKSAAKAKAAAAGNLAKGTTTASPEGSKAAVSEKEAKGGVEEEGDTQISVQEASSSASAVVSPARPVKGLFERRTREEMRFHIPARRPRGELPPDAVDPESGLPILHPKAMNLPVPPPTPDLIGMPEKWSFTLTPQKVEHTVNMYHVPNSEPPALRPMHMSSLTIPAMEKRRFCVASWASMEDQGPIADTRADKFIEWVKHNSRTHGAHSELYHAQLDDNVSLCLGHRMVRGVYAKKHFFPGDVILDIPIDQDPSNVASYGSILNAERMKLCSRVANREGVQVPTLKAIVDVLNDRRCGAIEAEFHPLFAEQLLTASYIALEKAAGDASPLYPYLSLFPDPMFDDEGIILETNREVVGTRAMIQYKEHIKVFRNCMVQIRRDAWPTGGCPPSLKDLIWGMRFVLSRQMMLERIRLHCDDILPYAEDAERTPDFLTKGIRAAHRFLLHNVLGVLDEKREHVNEFHPRSAPCVVPLLDMIGHDPAGISANISISVEQEGREKDEESSLPDKLGPVGRSLVVRATEEIWPEQPLQRLFPRCFSIGYTLFRYGFLPLIHRDVDRRASALEFDVPHMLPAPGVPDAVGTDGAELPRRFLEATLDGRPPAAAAAKVIADEPKGATPLL